MHRNRTLLVAIILAATVIRFWGLGHNPPGLWCDEAANGYDAYSIWMTGRDLHGRFLPLLILHHKSAIAEGLYTYLTVPFVALFGLNETSIRAVSALFGVLTVWSTFLLAKKMFGANVALTACLFLALSPWHVLYSRWSGRPILLPFLITLGLYFFLEGIERPRLLLGAGAAFGISAYTYSTIYVFLPALLAGMLIIYRREILRREKRGRLIVSAIIIIAVALPMVLAVASGRTSARFEQISVLNADRPFTTFLKNYASHYSPSFLFLSGDANLRHSIPYIGQELFVLAPFMAAGLIKVIAERKKEGLLLIYWIIIAAVPAALTNEGIPHAGRSFQFIPSLEILAAVGFMWAWGAAGAARRGPWLRGVISSAVAVNMAVFLFLLFSVYPSVSAPWWQYGMREALAAAAGEAGPSEPIFITRHVREPYIHVLFYTQEDPVPWQTERSLGRFILCRDDMRRYYNPGRPGVYIVRPGELPGSRPVKIVRFPSGEDAFEIVR